ncbi:MAG: hypothetical protein WAS21_10690 [Geminicoccaceae bacterium]
MTPRSILVTLLVLTSPAAAQQPPRALFPLPAPVAAPSPAATPTPTAPEPPIAVEPLAAPTLASLGLAGAEAELGGPLWTHGAPEALAVLFGRLPTYIADPILAGLQKALLTAPGPAVDAPRELFLLRVDRLLAMAEPAAALDLLALVPEGPPEPELESRRLQARFALGQVEPACATSQAVESAVSPWPQARIVCAALAGDAAAVQLGLDLLDARGESTDTVLAELARATVGGERLTLRLPVPDDPLLLPLLRRAVIDVDPAAVVKLPAPVRRALLDNPNLASATRAAAAGPPRPGPSTRPELSGRPPTDWTVAMESVPSSRRARWLALADGLGLDVPETIWTNLVHSPIEGDGPAPDVALWRGFEVARAGEQRGAMLLYTLLLLDGRPETAAAITLRRSLDALSELGLDDAARSLAASTGGALGL